MKSHSKRLFSLFWTQFLTLTIIYAQWQPSVEEKSKIVSELYRTIQVLASDSLEGREAGTSSEIKARDYIVTQMKEIKLSPYFSTFDYSKPFLFSSANTYTPSSCIVVGTDTLFFERDFSVAGNYRILESESESVNIGKNLNSSENGYLLEKKFEKTDFKNKFIYADISYPKEYSFITKENLTAHLQKIIDFAEGKEAEGVVFYRSKSDSYTLDKSYRFENNNSGLQILYIYEPVSLPEKEWKTILRLQRQKLQAYNIGGLIDNKAQKTIVIGAHYDHLGYGIHFREGINPAIHPGADDNASGVSMMLELARFVKQKRLTNYNYLFLAFSAEEKGLLGSKAFVEDTVNKLGTIAAMLNLDMLGRLDTLTRKLNVFGATTSLELDSVLSVTKQENIVLMKSTSVSSGSDHVNFFNKNIPVLFFITGLHKDYHTPLDIPERINKEGMYDVYVFLCNLLLHIDNTKKIIFSTGASIGDSGRQRVRNGVTLGVVPDHVFEGKGLKIESVIQGKPAQKTGLQAGDVILRLNNTEVINIYTYMEILSKLKIGDNVNAEVKRGNEILQFEISF